MLALGIGGVWPANATDLVLDGRPLGEIVLTKDTNRMPKLAGRSSSAGEVRQPWRRKGPSPAQGALFFFDTATGTLLPNKFEPAALAPTTGVIASTGSGHVVGWLKDPPASPSSILYSVDCSDPSNPTLAYATVIPYALPVTLPQNQTWLFDYRAGPDGYVWSFLGDKLIRINPANGTVEPMGAVRPAGPIAFASGGRVFLGGTPSLREIGATRDPVGWGKVCAPVHSFAEE